MRPMYLGSGIQVSDCSKLAVNWKNGNDVRIFRHDVVVNFFTAFSVFCQA